ncbi:MAG: hypothetical protein KGH91_01725 [Rhodospirillales bacterium]|nr:hypothetical protein [Rhodospirillales bacterium]
MDVRFSILSSVRRLLVKMEPSDRNSSYPPAIRQKISDVRNDGLAVRNKPNSSFVCVWVLKNADSDVGLNGCLCFQPPEMNQKTAKDAAPNIEQYSEKQYPCATP